VWHGAAGDEKTMSNNPAQPALRQKLRIMEGSLKRDFSTSPGIGPYMYER
jgi:hypothetical protein